MLKERWEHTALYNKILAVTAAIATFFAVLNLAVLTYQTRILEQSGVESTKQSEHLLKHAESIASAMERTVEQNKAAAEALTAITHAEQRAWVAFEEIHLGEPLAVGKVPVVVVSFINTGKSPAFDVTAHIVCYYGNEPADRKELDDMFSGDESSPLGNQVLAAGLSGNISSVMTAKIDKKPDKLTRTELDSIQQRNLTFYLVTRLRYRDIYGQKHFTDSHTYLIIASDRTYHFLPLSEGNDCD